MDPAPNPAIFVNGLQDSNLLLFEGTFHRFSKKKSIQKPQNSRNQVFFTISA
jgi:hypothetical protein